MQPPRGAGALERWLARLLRDHADRVLAIDGRVAEEWGRLSAVRPGSIIDVLLAAIRDVEWTDVGWLNPFEPPSGAR